MQQLIDCLNEMERLHAQKNLRAYTDMDSKLHGLLIELCGNSLLESIVCKDPFAEPAVPYLFR